MIHSTAIISKNNTEIGKDVIIGPYSMIGDNVNIADGTVIGAHVVIEGPTRIGKNNRIFHHCSIGTEPQDITYNKEFTELIIGDNNTIREFCYINRGTVRGKKKTVIGNNNYLMGYSHIAHDCILKDHIIMANSANLAGHVEVHDHAFIGGLTGIHQFCKVGAYTMVGGATAVGKNVLPYTIASGNRAKTNNINIIGLERNNFSKEKISIIRDAFNIIFKSNHTISEAVRILIDKYPDSEEIAYLRDFIKESENRGIADYGTD